MKNNALLKDVDYPYTSGKTGRPAQCKSPLTGGVVKTNGTVFVKTDNASIMAAINQKPVAVAVCSSCRVYQYYTSGVITTGCCTAVDHANVAVGYGTDATTGLNYFLLRNSWGSNWGD